MSDKARAHFWDSNAGPVIPIRLYYSSFYSLPWRGGHAFTWPSLLNCMAIMRSDVNEHFKVF